ncbi:MAG: HAD-IIB family hydrolase [Chloroflexi bacterium]|nr:HAD-IIB family hydrolase [Chloroflexota bacterium]
MARPGVLISDLDGTLLGDPAALGRFAAVMASWPGRPRLVYATGRTARSVWYEVDHGGLPPPDAIITDVGTAIAGSDREPWPEWPTVRATWDVTMVRAALLDLPALALQPEVAQTPWKVSYHAPGMDRAALLRAARTLRRAGIRGRLIYSSCRDLDVLPRGVGKGPAARYVLARWGIEPGDAVTAGDTGNDRDLLRTGGVGIVVGNAHPELAALRSRAGNRIIRVTSGHADGVLEGLSLVAPGWS